MGDEGGIDAADAADAADAVDGAAPLLPCSPAAPTASCVLADKLVKLGSIAAANGNVYFTRHESAGPILQVPRLGGAVATFHPGSNLPAGLSTTPTALYWVTQGDFQIVRQSFDASTPLKASTYGLTLPAAQIVDVDSDTFWTVPGTGTDGQLLTTSNFGGGTAIASDRSFPTALAADMDHVYFAMRTPVGQVVRMAHNGTAVTTADGSFVNVNSLALSSAGIVALVSAGGVFRTSTATDATFMSGWAKVSANATGVALVADDAGTLYVLAQDGALEVIPNGALQPAETRRPGCAAGTALALDDTYVYLACKDTTDTIVRVLK